MTALALILPGMLIMLGLFLVVAAFRPQHVRLDDALASLGDSQPSAAAGPDSPSQERLGAWWLRRRPIVVSATTQRELQLKGRTLARHYSVKVRGALVGFLVPLAAGLIFGLLGRGDLTVSLLASVVGAVVGFVWPDLQLRSEGQHLTADATESLLTYFDLVTLERMANQSATQSLHAAAAISDSTIFAMIRAALERARLEQRMPYGELKDVGRRLELPALVDMADVMRLDESGAALSGTLRARVKELRDAHLTSLKMAATAVSERMTVFMVVPSMIFGLMFLAPPLLRLVSGQ
jgi:tight adherence protein C